MIQEKILLTDEEEELLFGDRKFPVGTTMKDGTHYYLQLENSVLHVNNAENGFSFINHIHRGSLNRPLNYNALNDNYNEDQELFMRTLGILFEEPFPKFNKELENSIIEKKIDDYPIPIPAKEFEIAMKEAIYKLELCQFWNNDSKVDSKVGEVAGQLVERSSLA